MTFKQLEAIYWIARLGGFSQAAQKLITTQSAVSKRVQELEFLFKEPLFDRSGRSKRLTEVGEEVFVMAERLLEQRDTMMRRLAAGEANERHMRIGVTEVTAMTWLPRFLESVNAKFPKLIVDPEVDSGSLLRDKLLAGEIDMMVAADAFRDDRLKVTRVGKLQLHWMCRRGLVAYEGKFLRLQELTKYRLLTQGSQSGTGLLFQDWFKTVGAESSDIVVSNSLLALIGLTVAGFGISYLPMAAVDSMVDTGLLEVLEVRPPLPDVPYAALVRRDQHSSLVASVIRLAQETCDFSTAYQTSSAYALAGNRLSRKPRRRQARP